MLNERTFSLVSLTFGLVATGALALAVATDFWIYAVENVMIINITTTGVHDTGVGAGICCLDSYEDWGAHGSKDDDDREENAETNHEQEKPKINFTKINHEKIHAKKESTDNMDIYENYGSYQAGLHMPSNYQDPTHEIFAFATNEEDLKGSSKETTFPNNYHDPQPFKNDASLERKLEAKNFFSTLK